MSDRYAAIVAERGRYPVQLMCGALEVSVSGFYASEARKAGPPGRRAVEEEQLRLVVRESHKNSRRRYGAPRVHQDLRAAGTRVAKKRVARLMREEGLSARRRPRRRPVTTDSGHGRPVAPNRLARRFSVSDVCGVNQVWVADITYVPTREGWLYLGVVVDLASRRVVGWAMRETLEREIALEALHSALRDRRPASGLLQHTDRGSQYASHDYQELLRAYGITCSMSRRGDCYDNAVAESFFATLEHELLAETDFGSRAEARQAIFVFIEVWYNRERRHSSLGYVTPVAYEAQLAEAELAAQVSRAA